MFTLVLSLEQMIDMCKDIGEKREIRDITSNPSNFLGIQIEKRDMRSIQNV